MFEHDLIDTQDAINLLGDFTCGTWPLFKDTDKRTGELGSDGADRYGLLRISQVS